MDPGGIDPGDMRINTISFNVSLPLLGVGLLTLLLSFCFCFYLWRLKRQSAEERGYTRMCPVCLDEFHNAEKVPCVRVAIAST
nr:hypothetical protein BaRGS_018415 [Batillaria attramentaria]